MANAAATLEDLDDGFTTATATYGGGDLELKDLSDGEYEFEVKSMEVKETDAGPLVKWKLGMLTDGPHSGKTLERTYWLTAKDRNTGQRVRNERQIAELRKDLVTLGFDADLWTKENDRPFSREIGKVSACIVGVCFKAKKKQGAKKDDGSHYQNLYVNERVLTDGKPPKFGPTELAEANADPFGE